MKKETLICILLLIIGALPPILFTSTISQEVFWDNNSHSSSSVQQITIYQWNPLLGNRYVILVGGTFTSFVGTVNGDFKIYDITRGRNTTYPFEVDATNTYIETSYTLIELVLLPGDYIINFTSDVTYISYYLFTRGWFINTNNAREVNFYQFIAIGVFCLLFVVITILTKIYYFNQLKKL